MKDNMNVAALHEELDNNERMKLPVGLKPKWIHDSERLKDLIDAIKRYTDAEMPIPKEWVEELRLFHAMYLR